MEEDMAPARKLHQKGNDGFPTIYFEVRTVCFKQGIETWQKKNCPGHPKSKRCCLFSGSMLIFQGLPFAFQWNLLYPMVKNKTHLPKHLRRWHGAVPNCTEIRTPSFQPFFHKIAGHMVIPTTLMFQQNQRTQTSEKDLQNYCSFLTGIIKQLSKTTQREN